MSRVEVLQLDVTTPRDSYAWNHMELANDPTDESLADDGAKPLTIKSMGKKVTKEHS